MRIMNIKKNINGIILWVVFLISFIFVYSGAYHNIKLDYIKEVVLAFMAASVTILITSMLLRQQTDSAELKDNHAEIFKKKFEIYEEFFESMIALHENQSITDEDIKSLEASFYKLLLFMQEPKSFYKLYDTITSSLQNNDRKHISQLIYVLKEELGIYDDNAAWANAKFCRELDQKMSIFAKAAEKLQ